MSAKVHRRGFSLVMVMAALVLLTLLVAGAIAFTGQERNAAVIHTRSQTLSGCAQAARNLFLAQVRAFEGNIASVSLDAGISNPNLTGSTIELVSAHYTGSVTLQTFRRLNDSSMGSAQSTARDLSNRTGTPAVVAGYYLINALCREKAGGTEREIEFVIRLGI